MVWGIVSAVAVFIILAIAASKVERGWERAEDSLRRALSRRRQSRDLKRSDVREIASRHAADFEERGLLGELFAPSTVTGASATPILVNERSLTIRAIELQDDAFLSIGNPRRVDFAVNEQLVKATLASGRRLTDDSVLYLDKVTGIGGEYDHISVGITGYRATATLAHRVTRALDGDNAEIAPEEFGSLDVALSSQALRPMVIGSDAACVFTDGGRRVVPIHRRSAKTVNAPGAYTLTPAYTYEANVVGSVASRFGVIGYNFLREFLEEFWGDEKLVESSSRPRAHPDWIFDSEPGSRLLAEVVAGRIQLHCVGVGIDVSCCCLTIALAAKFDSQAFLQYVMGAPGGWEDSGAGGGRPAIEFPELFGPETDEMMLSNMKPTTVLALDGARRLFSEDTA